MEKLKISLLYVEDDASLRNIYSKILKLAIEKVIVASDGLSGYELFLKHHPDIILTDIRLPVITGLEMISKIRQVDKAVRVIILSAFAEPRYFLGAIAVGVKGYLLKPAESEVLLKMIEEQAHDILLDKKVIDEEHKRRQAELAKERGEAILQSLAYSTVTFFNEGFDERTVVKVLKSIGESTKSARVYIFQNFKDERGKQYTSLKQEWVADNISAEIENPVLQKLYVDDPMMIRWTEEMQKGGHISGLVKNFPDLEREILEAQDILSILAMPIFVQHKWWGFIGIDVCDEERIWSSVELNAMETVASNLGAAIYRKQVEAELLELNTYLERRVSERTNALQKEVTERKLAELRLKESEEKYRLIYENANNGIILLIDNKIVMVNPEVTSILKMSPRVLIGKPLENIVLRQDKSALKSYFQSISSTGEVYSIDIRVRSGRGDTLWVEVRTNSILWNDEPAYLIFFSDITNRKKAEKEINKLNKVLGTRVAEEVQKVKQQQQLLVQKSKLEFIGELSAGLSHEINQPLGGISMGLENILLRIEENDKVDKKYIRDKFSVLFHDVDRINQIIEHVRIFSRDQQNVFREEIDPVKVILNALSMIKVQMQNHNVNLEMEIEEDQMIVIGNQYRLEQVVVNLLSNARYAVEEKKKANNLDSYSKTIRVKCVRNNNNCIIGVYDNGVGISDKYINNIFDPFFTTKDEEKGTGLGLSISYGIVKEMGGKIDVESREGLFSNFVVTLPLKK
ncbi:MAG: response regulator [Bacteroidales bacterium]|nr:response regulator [Bacteroidales bacterium]